MSDYTWLEHKHKDDGFWNYENASIVVKISENKTTILAIVHGFVVCFGKDCINAKQTIIILISSILHIERWHISCTKSK